MVKRKQLNDNEALTALKLIQRIPVRLIAVDIQQALKLAFEFKIYAYDAYFLQCAKSLSEHSWGHSLADSLQVAIIPLKRFLNAHKKTYPEFK